MNGEFSGDLRRRLLLPKDVEYTTWWISGRTGIAKPDSASGAIHFTASPQFGGLEADELRRIFGSPVSQAATPQRFAHSLIIQNFDYADLAVELDTRTKKVDSGYRFTEILTRPRLTLESEVDQKPVTRLLGRHRSCAR